MPKITLYDSHKTTVLYMKEGQWLPHIICVMYLHILCTYVFGKTSNDVVCDVVCDIQGILVYSKDSGASWATVAQDIHPQY